MAGRVGWGKGEKETGKWHSSQDGRSMGRQAQKVFLQARHGRAQAHKGGWEKHKVVR